MHHGKHSKIAICRIVEEETELTAIGSQLAVNSPPPETKLLEPRICLPQPTISLSQPLTPLPQESEIRNSVAEKLKEGLPRIINDINMSTFLANFKPTLSSRYWMAGKRNVLKAWQLFKTQCAEKCNGNGICVESDAQLIL